jgi:hemin uptake protein HemP
MADSPDRPKDQPPENGPSEPPRILRAQDLFRGDREICIELDGTRYRLRMTRRNKLILQK